MTLYLYTCIIVPSGPPEHFEVISITAYSIEFKWNPPRQCSRSGNITHYSLNCSFYNITHPQLLQSLVNETINDQIYSLNDLLPFTNYTCQLIASTSVGKGPAVNITVTTNESSM